jgi:hypothetical protein
MPERRNWYRDFRTTGDQHLQHAGRHHQSQQRRRSGEPAAYTTNGINSSNANGCDKLLLSAMGKAKNVSGK